MRSAPRSGERRDVECAALSRAASTLLPAWSPASCGFVLVAAAACVTRSHRRGMCSTRRGCREVGVQVQAQVGVVALDELSASCRPGTGRSAGTSAPSADRCRPRSAARGPAASDCRTRDRSVWVALMTWVATVPRLARLCSRVMSLARSSARIFSACGKVSSASVSDCFCWFRVDGQLVDVRQRVGDLVLLAVEACRRRCSSGSSRSRTSPSLPLQRLVELGGDRLDLLRPPPFSSSDSAPSTSSTSGALPVRDSGMTAPFASAAPAGWLSGWRGSTNFSPSSEVCCDRGARVGRQVARRR